MKKYFRILYVLPIVSWITALILAFRYIWFGIPTVGELRIILLLVVLFFSSLLFLYEIDNLDM